MKCILFLALACCLGAIMPVFAQDPAPADPPAGAGGMMTPEMHQRMMAFVQDVLIMSQNTAIDTPEGIIVLQGNTLTKFSPDLKPVRTVMLPVPPPEPVGTAPMPGMVATKPLRSMVLAKLLTRANGDVIVVRGQQVIRLDRELRVTSQATLPDIPPLTPAELAVIAPISGYMTNMMMMSMPGMPGGMTGMTPPAAQ